MKMDRSVHRGQLTWQVMLCCRLLLKIDLLVHFTYAHIIDWMILCWFGNGFENIVLLGFTSPLNRHTVFTLSLSLAHTLWRMVHFFYDVTVEHVQILTICIDRYYDTYEEYPNQIEFQTLLCSQANQALLRVLPPILQPGGGGGRKLYWQIAWLDYLIFGWEIMWFTHAL